MSIKVSEPVGAELVSLRIPAVCLSVCLCVAYLPAYNFLVCLCVCLYVCLPAFQTCLYVCLHPLLTCLVACPLQYTSPNSASGTLSHNTLHIPKVTMSHIFIILWMYYVALRKNYHPQFELVHVYAIFVRLSVSA